MTDKVKPRLVKPILRFALATVLIVAAFLAREVLVSRFGHDFPAFITFYPAIMLIALVFGPWAGLMGTALASLLAAIWIYPPYGKLTIERPSDIVALTLFAFMGVFMSVVAERFRRTQRKLAAAQQELEISETRRQLEESSAYRQIALEAAEMGAWDYRLDSGEVIWDDACRRAFGVSSQERLTYERVGQCIHPEDRARADEAVKQAIAGMNGGAYHSEVRAVWPDGTVHWISSHGKVYFQGEGGQKRPVRFIGVLADITQRKQAEEAIRASEERYRLLAETMLQGVVHQDADGLIVAMNPAAERILCWTHAEYLGKTSAQVDAETIREDGTPFPGNEHPSMVALRTGQSANAVMGVAVGQPDGPRWISVTSVPLFRPGHTAPYQVYSLFEDITERKKADAAINTVLQRFYVILSNLHSAVLLVTDDGRVEFANHAFCYRFGLDVEPLALAGLDAAQMIGMIRHAYRDPEQALSRIQEIVAQGNSIIGEELPMRDGETCLRDYVPLKVDGKSYGRLWVHTDITQRKQAERALQTQSERFYRVLSNLYSGVLLVTNEGKVEFINQACCDLLGLTESPQELAGLDSGSWTAKMSAACHFPVQATSRALDLAAQATPVIGEEVTMPGGKTFVRDFVPLTFNGKSYGRLWVLTDITQQKRAETELRAREQRLRLAAEAAQLGVFEWTVPTDTAVWENKRMYEIFGIPETTDAVNRDRFVRETLHPEDLERFTRELEEAMQPGALFRGAYRIRRGNDGQWRWIQYFAKFDLTPDGKPVRLLGVLEDITERKRAEARLLRLYETDLFAVLYWKIDGGVVDANDQFLKITGYTRQDMHAGLMNWSEMTPPEYQALDEDARRQVRETGVHQAFEKEFIRKDGTRVSVEIWAAAYEDDRTQGVSFALDITERKRAENDLRRAKSEWERTFNSVPDLIAILDNNHHIVRANRAMAQRFGTSAEACAGLACYTCVHGASAPTKACPHTLTLLDHCEHTAEIHEDRLGGDFLVTTTPLFNERGEMDGSVHVARDITEHKRAEDALRLSEERFRLAAAATHSMVYELDVSTLRVISQSGLEVLLGYQPSEIEMTLEWWNSRIDPEDLSRCHAFLAQMSAERSSGTIQYGVRHKDDHTVWVEDHAACIVDGSGVPAKIVGTVFDITERKMAELEVQDSEKRYRNLFNAMNEGFCIIEVLFDTDGTPEDYRFLEINDAFEAQTGLHDAVGKRMRDLAPAHEEHWFEIYGRIALTGEPAHFMNVAAALDRYYDVHAYRVGEPQQHRVAIVFNDISDYKRAEEALRTSEERLRLALEAGRMGTWDVDLSSGHFTWNDEMFLMLGYQPGSITPNYEAWTRRVLPEDWVAADFRFRESLESGIDLGSEYRVLGRNDEVHWVEARGRSERDENGKAVRSFGVMMDITERKHAEEALRASEERLRLALEAGRMATWDTNLLSDHSAWNDEMFHLLGYQPGSIEPHYEAWKRRVLPEDLPGADARLWESFETGRDLRSEYRVLSQNDEIRWVEARGRSERDETGKAARSFGVMMDITERKRAEEALRASELRFRLALTNAPVSVAMQDRDLVYRWAYNQHTRTSEEIVGKTDADLFEAEDIPAILQVKRRVLETGMPENVQQWLMSNGKRLYLDLYYEPTRNSAGEIDGIGIAVVDLTESKLAEEALRASEAKHRSLAESINDPFFAMDKDLRFTFWSQRTADINGVPPEVALGKTRLELFGESESQRKSDAMCRLCLKTQKPVNYEVQWTFGGNSRLFEVQLFPYAGGVATIGRDITERKLAEEQLHKLNRTLTALSNCNQTLLQASDEEAFLHQVCRIITEDCGYVMVWIGYAENDPGKSIRPVAWSGFEDGYLKNFRLTWDASGDGLGPSGTAIRTGQPAMCRNMLTDPSFAPWRAEAIRRGYASLLVIPLKENDQAFGTITIYSHAPDAFSKAEIRLLTELAGDLALGIRTLRVRAAHAEAETALRESEERLALFIEHAPAALAMFDNQMRYVSVSRRWKSDYGVGDRDLRGLSHYEVFPEISEEWKQLHRQGLAGAVLHRDTDRFERADGSVQWLRWEIRPWKDREGKIGGILVFTEDITDRKLADDAIREQAELLDLAHDTIMVCDLDGTIRFWNHGAQEMYGYTREQAVGKKSHELLGTVFPRPIDEIKAKVVREGRWEGELAHVTRDGVGIVAASRWVLQRDKDGLPCGVMEINNDITERMRLAEAQREANVKLQSVLDSITDGLLVLDEDWRYTYCSDHGARMLGFSPEDLLGKCVWEVFPHTAESKFGEAYRQAVETRHPVHFEAFYPEPLNMWLECHCYPTPEGLSVYFRDISERKRTEEALLRSEKLASVGRMAATIAHEINNPLAAMTNTLFLANMQADNPDAVRQFLGIAEDELKRIAHITRQTLGFYRESSVPAPVAIHTVLESALDLMKAKIGARRAVVETDWDGQEQVVAIAGELRQVFSNLLGNSLDAIEEGGRIKLHVASCSDPKDGHPVVHITVADNGKGIEAASRPHIFEPFFTTKGSVGTGLGLWVSHQIVEKHHGTIRLRSSTHGPVTGTAFMVTLPGEAPVHPAVDLVAQPAK